MNPVKFKVGRDTLCKCITGIVLGIMIGVVYLIMQTAEDLSKVFLLVGLFLIAIIMTLYFCAWTITVNDKDINIKCSFHTITLPIANMETIMNKDLTPGDIRVFGSGGFLGYCGIYHSRALGRYISLLGSRSNPVYIKMKDGAQYMLSCDNSHEFVSLVTSLKDK